jgi:hypothetical protein
MHSEDKTRQLAIIQKYPRLFRDLRSRTQFECNNGWDGIIEEMCAKAYPLLPDEDEESIIVVKEKYGTLRIQGGCFPDAIFKIFDEAEKKSQITCEVCGDPGVLRGGGWLRTLCDEHSAGRIPLK